MMNRLVVLYCNPPVGFPLGFQYPIAGPTREGTQRISSPTDRDKCETGSQFFVREFSHNWSAIDILFQMAISFTSVWMAQVELDHLHGQRGITDDDTRRGIIDVLERAYRETGETVGRSTDGATTPYYSPAKNRRRAIPRRPPP
jgi:hypothetical protein